MGLNRRSIKRSLRYYAMLFGLNMRKNSHPYPLPGRGSLRTESVRLSKAGSGFRRRLRITDLIWYLATIWIIAAGFQCLGGDCKPLELVIREVKSQFGGH
jgi:hypothetical protein